MSNIFLQKENSYIPYGTWFADFGSLLSFLNFRELLLDFYTSSGKRKPDQIIIFRQVLHGCTTLLNLAFKVWDIRLCHLLAQLTFIFCMFLKLLLYLFLSRDGVSESQFNQVLNVELDQIIQVLCTAWLNHSYYLLGSFNLKFKMTLSLKKMKCSVLQVPWWKLVPEVCGNRRTEKSSHQVLSVWISW